MPRHIWGRMEEWGCPETHRQPQAVPARPKSQREAAHPLGEPKQGGFRCPHPGDDGSPALTWRRGQPGAGSGTWHNPSLQGARSSLPGKKDSALGRGGLVQLLSTPGDPFPPAPPRFGFSTAVSQHPGTAAFTQGLRLPFGQDQDGGSRPGRVCLPAQLLRKAARGALSQRWSKGEIQARGCNLTPAPRGWVGWARKTLWN